MAVRIIPARQPETMGTSALKPKLRVAAYCRVSTDENQETSYEAQVAHYTDYIINHEGWELAGIFADEAISGTGTAKREQFLAMIAACENGDIDLVITKSVSRWARNTLDSLQNIRKLKTLGIPVIFEKENCNTMESSGELMITLLSSLAQQESESISKNVRIGLQYGFQRGKPMLNHTTFLGYTKERGDTELSIVPEEADTVRQIFRDFLEGYSIGEIKDMLEKTGVKTPAGKDKWYHSTIISMLKNEKFMGDLLLQKTYTVDFLTKEKAKNCGEFPQYYVENAHPPIVPKEVFMRVQGELMRRELEKGSGSGRPTLHLALNGKIECGDCRSTYRRCSSPYEETVWRCRHQSRKKYCTGRAVKEKAVKDAVVEAFSRLPECREDLIRMQERIQWGPLKMITRELEAIEDRKSTLEAIISDYAATGTLDQRTIFLYTDEDEEGVSAEAAIEHIKNELDDLEFQRDSRLTYKAELAVQEVQIRSLLKLIGQKAAVNPVEGCAVRMATEDRTEERDGDLEENDSEVTDEEGATQISADEGTADDVGASCEPCAACYDLADFYDRTDRIPEDTTFYSEDLVKRYIRSITVKARYLLVRFKAGVEIRVKL